MTFGGSFSVLALTAKTAKLCLSPPHGPSTQTDGIGRNCAKVVFALIDTVW